MKARRTVFIYSKKLSYIQPIRMIFVGFNLCQRIFFNKVVGTVHVHPLKLNIYTFVLISFKPCVLKVKCYRKTRYDFLTKKLRQFLFLACFNYPKACLKLEVNKTQTFTAPLFSSLYKGHYVKFLCIHSIRITLNEASHNLQFLPPK